MAEPISAPVVTSLTQNVTAELVIAAPLLRLNVYSAELLRLIEPTPEAAAVLCVAASAGVLTLPAASLALTRSP